MKDLKKKKENADKALLTSALIIGIQACFLLIGGILISAYSPIKENVRNLIMCISFVLFFLPIPWMLRLEQMAGYYVCPHCSHKHASSLKNIVFALHIGWTRYLKCPKCEKRGWNKKIIKEE